MQEDIFYTTADTLINLDEFNINNTEKKYYVDKHTFISIDINFINWYSTKFNVSQPETLAKIKQLKNNNLLFSYYECYKYGKELPDVLKIQLDKQILPKTEQVSYKYPCTLCIKNYQMFPNAKNTNLNCLGCENNCKIYKK